MGLNFVFVSAHGRDISSIVTYISWYRRRSPGDGHTATLGEDNDGCREIPRHVNAELHQAERHSMAIESRIIAQTHKAKQLGICSHARHLLS